MTLSRTPWLRVARRCLVAASAAVALVVVAGPALARASDTTVVRDQDDGRRGLDGLAPTPPMGFNNWARYQCAIDEQLFIRTADALVRTGLAARGYDMVAVDDCWMARARDPAGNLVADPVAFPHGMAWLANQLHGRGLRFGTYADIGHATCSGYPGSQYTVQRDADSFAAFGADYLKLDACFVDVPQGASQAQTYRQLFAAMGQALRNTGRPIVYSGAAPPYFFDFVNTQQPGQWYSVVTWANEYSHLTRLGRDIALHGASDKWASVMSNYEYTWPLARYSGPNHWNDADMLIVGDGLSLDEARSQMALWSMMASPLLLSTDVSALNGAELAILGNRDVIAIDQDRLGLAGAVISRGPTVDVLARPLAGGDRAVALLNRGSSMASVTTHTTEVGFTSTAGCAYTVKDLWTGSTTSTTGAITATVSSHGTAMLRITPSAGCAAQRPTGQITGTGGSCLDATNGDPADGTPIVLWRCHGLPNQRWAILADGTIRTLNKCLDVTGGTTTPGTRIQLWSCHGGPNQQWEYRPDGTLISLASGLCLDAFDNGTADGTPLIIWPCGAYKPNQIWTLPT